MGFGLKLQGLRKAAGLTQAALSERAGVPLGTLRDLEQEKREPMLSNAQKLATALGVSLDEFIEPVKPAAKAKPRKGK